MVPDQPPSVIFGQLYSSIESITQAEIQSGLVQLLQGTAATLTFTATDDVGIVSLTASYGDQQLLAQTMLPTKNYYGSLSITPPVGLDGAPAVVLITVTDTQGQVGKGRLVVEGRRPQPPAIAISAPAVGEMLAEGSIQLAFQAIAGDDTRVASVDLYLNGQQALHLINGYCNWNIDQQRCGAKVDVIQDHLDADGVPIAQDAAIRQVAQKCADSQSQAIGACMPEPFNDVTLVGIYSGVVKLPPGFVALDPAQAQTTFSLRAVATDDQGNRTLVERDVVIAKDETPPAVDILRPTLGQDLVEHTPALVQVAAHDNVFVDRVEILAGPSTSQMQVVHVEGGFPPENAMPGAGYDVYAPVVSVDLPVPFLSELGFSELSTDPAPYFIGARARDVSGNWSDVVYRLVDVVRDREPSVWIVSPADGSPAVENSPLTAVVSAEDDVAMQTVQLFVDDQLQPLALSAPPFFFTVTVPQGQQQLKLRALGVDTFGHAVYSQTVLLPIAVDRPPTVAIAQPRQGEKLVEGLDFALVIGAQDDVAVTSVEATVEGGIGGPLTFAARSLPYAFRVPLPNGSAGRTLTLNAKARDSAGHETLAAGVTVPVIADAVPPTVSFTTPADHSQIVAGLNLDVEAVADDNVGVVSVAFSLNGALLSTMPTAPYRFTYKVPKGTAPQTPLAFTAEATDTSGNKAQATRSVTVIQDEPPIAAVAPLAKMVVGLPSTLTATASDDVAVASVEFHLGTDPTSLPEVGRRYQLPFELPFTPDTSLVDKTVTVRARAVDSAGQEGWSLPVQVPVVADQPPSIQIAKPLPGAMVFGGGLMRLEANATDPDGGVVKVVFLVDGRRVDVAYTAAGVPGEPTIWAGSWVAPISGGNQTFALTAIAVDTAGHETTSAPVMVGTVQDTVPPAVALVDPPNLDVVTEGVANRLFASAEDNTEVKSVEFFVEGASLGSTSASEMGPSHQPLFHLDWQPPTGTPGQSRTIQATAVDPSNNLGLSQNVQVELGMRPSGLYYPVGKSDPPALGALALRADGLGLAAYAIKSQSDVPEVETRFFRVQESGVLELGLLTSPEFGAPAVAAFSGDLALIATNALGTTPASLLIINAADVAMPVELGSIDLPQPVPYGIAARDRLAFVANGDAGVVIVDLSDPKLPQRLDAVPVVGSALGIAVAGDVLAVAAAEGGLRLLDLKNPRLGELSFVALPGRSAAVAVAGDRAYVGCQSPGAEVAVVDISKPAQPRLLSLLSNKPARLDLLATGIVDVAAAGNLALATAALTDQDGNPVKGLLSASVVRPDGTASTFARANLPVAAETAYGPAWVVARQREQGPTTTVDAVPSFSGADAVGTFSLPQLVVTNLDPADGAEQVPLGAAVTVELSLPPLPSTVTASSVVLRALDPALGPAVTADVTVDNRSILVKPQAALQSATQYFLSISTAVATDTGLALEAPFAASFRTGTSADLPPSVADVEPPAGPVDGGTLITVHGLGFAAGARLFLSGAEATQVQIAADGKTLTARTPPQVEGPALVTVLNPDGLEGSLLGAFIYMQVLQVDFVVPATGPLAGGQEVDLSGSGFERGAIVTFAGRPATEVHVLSPGRIHLKTPNGDFGPADVMVQNPDGKRALAPGAYFYSTLFVSSRIGRYQPDLDGPNRPDYRLAQGTPGAVAIDSGRAWILSRAQLATAAKTVPELLEKSVFGGVGLVDVGNPSQASVMGGASLVPPYDPVAIAVRGNLGYVVANGVDLPYVDVVGEGGPSFFVIDGSDPTGPIVASVTPFSGEAGGVALAGDLALVASGWGGLSIFSVADPKHPVLLGATSSFLSGGAVQSLYVEDVFYGGGRYAVLAAVPHFAGLPPPTTLLVVDLTLPGIPAVGELAGSVSLCEWNAGLNGCKKSGDVALAAGRGLLAGGSLSTLSLVPPQRARVVASPAPLISGAGAARVALGAQVGVAGGSAGTSALLQFLESFDPAQPRMIDAVDLYPAKSLASVAISGDVVVASIEKVVDSTGANDGLHVVRLPFPMVVKSQPLDGDTGVPPTAAISLELNRAVADASSTTVRLTRLDGSVSGVVEPATVTSAGANLAIVPAHPLATASSYRVAVDSLHDAVSGSPMAAPFTMEFATASSPTATAVTFAQIAPRQGPTAGATTVVLNGTGFEPGLEVRFAGQAADVQQVSADGTTITLQTPPGAEGTAAVEVRNPSGTGALQLGGYWYVAPLTLASASPNRGPTSGGTRVLLAGTGFSPTGTVQVLFAGQPGLQTRVLGVDRLETYTPNGLRGPADVTVVNPDGAHATLSKGFTFDQPTTSSIAFGHRVYDAAVIGDWAFLVDGGLKVIDLSGLYRFGPYAGLAIPPDRKADLIDENGDRVDDRIIGSATFSAEAVSISYPPEGGDLIYVGLRSVQSDSPSGPLYPAYGGVAVVDVGDPYHPRVLYTQQTGVEGTYGIDARGDRLMAATAGDGLQSLDISPAPAHAPFPISAVPISPAVQAVSIEKGFAAAGIGPRDLSSLRVGAGKLSLISVASTPAELGNLQPLSVQRVRLRGALAAVAAGDEGLVLVDVSKPSAPVRIAAVDVGGFASDVSLVGDLAYVAAGDAGVAVVDLSNLAGAQVLYHVTGANGGAAVGVAAGGTRLFSFRDHGAGGWSFDFGDAAELTLVTTSVSEGDVVPLDLSSAMAVFSTQITPDSAAAAFSLTANGQTLLGTLEAGTAAEPVSTALFRLAQQLPANAAMHLGVTTDLKTPDGKALIAPVSVDFLSASGPGPAPHFEQLVPRVGPASGGSVCELLGDGFDDQTAVRIGGVPASVLAVSTARLTVLMPPGAPGLADVEVVNSTGLSDRRPGGYLYVAPLSVDHASPRFLNPEGGSTVTLTGAGFLPAWTSPLGGMRVQIRGLPATSVDVKTLTHLEAVAPPGFFGPAEVLAISADGLQRSAAPNSVGYGLSLAGKEKVEKVAPVALAQYSANPLLLFAAAGSNGGGSGSGPLSGLTWGGNAVSYPWMGPLMGGGVAPESYRAASFDVSAQGTPRAAGGALIQPPQGEIDQFVAEKCGVIPGPVLQPELMADSLDVAERGGKLFIANGENGLAILDSTDPAKLALLGTARIDGYSTRVVPTATGSVVVSAGIAQCGQNGPALGNGGSLLVVDARFSTDPMVVGTVLLPGVTPAEPFGAAMSSGRLFVTGGQHEGTAFQSGPSCRDLPKPPNGSINVPQRVTDCQENPLDPHGSLYAFASANPGAQPAGILPYPYDLTDVAVVRDVAIVAAAEYGLLFVDVSDLAHLKEITRIPFDHELSNTPGMPQRLRVVGDLLFVAAASGSSVLVDISDPRQPALVSGGNTETAWDMLPVSDRLYLAGGNQLTEMSLPFTFATGTAPAREELVPPSTTQLVARFNRPLAPASVNDASVRLLGPSGVVALALAVTADPATLTYAITATAQQPLQPLADYELQVDDAVTDQRGGSLLIPLRTRFHTAAAGGRAPAIASLSPPTAPKAGGGSLALTGTGLGGVNHVLVGGKDAAFTVVSDTALQITPPPADATGPADVVVQDAGGISATLALGLLYLDDLPGAHASLSPDHGPVEGGQRVTLTVPGSALAPGTQVRIGDKDGVDVDLVDLSTLAFTTPRGAASALVSIALQRPGEDPVLVATYSYDLPVSTTMDLPGFPPRVASEIKLVGDTLYAGVPTPNYEGLEILDVTLEERPIRLGGVPTDGPVRGLDVSGSLALLATDSFGLSAVSVVPPQTPYQVARALTVGWATGVRIEGTLAFVTSTDPGAGAGFVQTFDASDPALPLMGTVPLDADPLALDLGADRFYALTSQITGGSLAPSGPDLHLTLYDRAGVRLGDAVVSGAGGSYEALVRSRLAVRSGRAYVTLGQRLLVFDLSDEAHPRAIQSTPLSADLGGAGGIGAGLAWAGGTLFVANDSSDTLIAVPPDELLAVSAEPSDGSLAAPDARVEVQFNQPVAPPSVTAATFAVTAGGAPIAGARNVIFALRGSTLEFKPDLPLTPGTVVLVDIDGVQAFDTRPLAFPLHLSFTVAESGALQPVITSVDPASGLVDQSTVAAIHGSGFRAGLTVRVGGVEALVTNAAADRLDVVMPPSPGLATGPAAVEVVDPSGLKADLLGGFVYRDPLRLLSLAPDRSGQQGGVTVALRGAGFLPGLGVIFGQTGSFDVRVTSSTLATAVAPPGSPGLVDVQAILGAESFTRPQSFLYGAGAVARLDTPPIAHLIVDGGVAYAAVGGETDVVGRDGTLYSHKQASSGGLLIADLGEPTAVKKIVQLDFPGDGGSHRVVKVGSTLYVAAGTAGTKVVDVTLPGQPSVLGTLAASQASVDVVSDGDLLFVADGDGVSAFRRGEADLPLLVGQRSLAGGATALAVHGRYLLASSGDAANPLLLVLDARKGDLPIVGSVPLTGPARHIAVEGTRAFAALGKLAEVAVIELADPTAPAPAGALVLTDPLGSHWMSAEETLIEGGIATVAAGGGKIQRFSAPVGQPAKALGTAAATGDVKTVAFMGRYLLAGTLVLDVNGTPVELPLDRPEDASGSLAGALASVALDHIELRATSPGEGDTAPASSAVEVILTDMPDPSSAGAVSLETDAGAAVDVARRVSSDPAGGKVVLQPQAALALGSAYRIRIGASLSDLQGGALGAEAVVRFHTAALASEERPAIARAEPAFGVEAGGEAISILGTGFLAGCAVEFGGAPATVVSVDASGERIQVVAPPGKAGAAAVEVKNPSGLSDLRLGAYRYLVLPHIAGIAPDDAPFESRQRVTLTGTGLFGGSQVLFGGVPARGVAMESAGSLLVEVPDGVTGVVDVQVATPGPAQPPSDTLAKGFTFTLKPIAELSQRGDAVASVGSALLVADASAGLLLALDASAPESPQPLGSVAGVAGATALTVVGDKAYLAGDGALVRYALGGCGSGPLAPCAPQELDRVQVAPPGTALSAVAATADEVFVASGGSELTLVGEVAGRLQVVGQSYVGGGTVRALAVAGSSLAVLVDESPTASLELHSLSDGSLAPLGAISGLPIAGLALSAHSMAQSGTTLAVAVADGARVVDAADPAAPAVVNTWSGAPTPPTGIAMAGPWILAGGGQSVALLDASDALAQRTFGTWAVGTKDAFAFVNGAAVAAGGSGTDVFELPYPVPASVSPLPGGALAPGGAVAVSLPGALPLTVAATTSLDVLDGGAPVSGTRAIAGASVRFAPAALVAGHVYEARVGLGAAPFVGGAVDAPWSFNFVGGPGASSLRVDSVTPSAGDVAGGYPVTLTGAGFDAATAVKFGGQLAANIAGGSAASLSVVAPPAAAAGPALVQVRNGAGDEVDLPGGFAYVAPLAVTSVSPAVLDVSGGWIRVTGTGFTRGLAVQLGGVPAQVQSINPTWFEALVPAGAPGPVALDLAQPGAAPLHLAAAVARADRTPPTVVRWEPMDVVGSDNVPLGASFAVHFNEAIDPASVASLKLALQSGPSVAGAASLGADGQSAVFAPAASLASTTYYVLSADGIADLSGNAMSASTSFRTVDVVPPTVSLTIAGVTVLPGSKYAADADWVIVPVAHDDSNSVSVTLQVDGVAVPPASSSGQLAFRYRWPASAANTASRLVATARDPSGNQATDDVTVQITADSPPSCSFLAPAVASLTLEEGFGARRPGLGRR